MDLSAFIFLALAVAWAVYLVPKALRHHDEVTRSRSVERFSQSMRVLARREPVDRRDARLVVQPGRAPSGPVVTTKGGAAAGPAGEAVRLESTVSVSSPAPAPPTDATVDAAGAPTRTPSPVARRAAARSAARRRRNVLAVLLLALVVVGVLAATAVVSWWSLTAPGALLVAWLVACRLMVRQERGLGRARRAPGTPAGTAAGTGGTGATEDAPHAAVTFVSEVVLDVALAAGPLEAPAPEPREEFELPGEVTEEISAVQADPTPDAALWDPVPVTLPTYVSKPAAARRTVRTIDLDDTGVWTSGRSEADSALAREADDQARAAKAARAEGSSRRTGS